ncbi:MAG: T9SS type A sorting domain-containing protein [Saprospiraceae bacterium]
MNNFKTLAVLSITFLIAHFTTAQSIIVESDNGNTSTINLNAIESIVFEDNNMVVNKSDCGDNYFNVSFSKKLAFEATITAIGEIESQTNSIAIYPNPVANTLIIDTQSDHHSNARIISANGSILKSFNMVNQQSEIDVSDLPSGLYFIIIDSQTSKFIKQ